MGWTTGQPINPPEREVDEEFDEYAGQPDTWWEV